MVLQNTFFEVVYGKVKLYWTLFFIVGRPEEQDDSENSTIYITGLTEKANLEEMAEFFKDVGPIRVRGVSYSVGLVTVNDSKT